MDTSNQIRLLRMELLAIRQKINRDLDALDMRLAALLPDDVPSFRVPKDYRASLDKDLEKRKRIDQKLKRRP